MVGPYEFTLSWDAGIADISDKSSTLYTTNITGGIEQIDFMECYWTAPTLCIYIFALRTGTNTQPR